MPSYRSHVALTVWPLLLLYSVALVRMWPALGGAQSYAAASPISWASLGACSVVVVVGVAAYARGWAILRRQTPEWTDSSPYRSAGCRRLQGIAGIVAWAFVVAHLLLRWLMTIRVGPVALSQYELFRQYLSRPPVLAVYVLGLGALGLFLSQGLAASVRAWGLATRAESSLRLEVGCTFVSAVLMLVAINVLSHFVTGRAYWSAS
ncbi:MAG: hypothetical protein PVH21_01550 [Myxococcales bacterium]